MARLEIAHRLKQRDRSPFALRGRAMLFEHSPDLLAQGAKLLAGRADDVARHDRGRSLS
jgi:hypothetical protein